MYAYTCSHRDKRRSCRLQPYTPNDKGAAEQVVISGILPILALSLRSRGPLTLLTAKLVAELAKESVVRKGFGDAGLVPALLSVLTSKDQELLLHATRAISRISYDSSKLQELFLRRGAVPRLVAILLRFPDKEALEEVCLQALCNISGMGVAEEAGMVWERGASVRPGESVFHGVSPHTCGFASSVTLVCVSQWAPGQYAVNIEVFQRCSSSFWNLHGNKRTARWFPFSSLGRCSNLYKVIKFSTRNVPRTKSLKARMFHTFL
ncbi:rap1 GTPase-GDP dissociation stimulator 1 isoform X2 [Siniperca chuatsi]|uniref:rap1 GTPase-GDP dissociation stimulator 1 isoform X2 n=1 Tax=Siniperca chuatsi TaxID=119488 RepID=UPI001CE16A38|nr:rap1 GTPase-GDP dissociation stimulator 1 isoform X2 [Siniperca chuatsi]